MFARIWRGRNAKRKRIFLLDWFWGSVLFAMLPLIGDIAYRYIVGDNLNFTAALDIMSANGKLLLLCSGLCGGPIVQALRNKKRDSFQDGVIVLNILLVLMIVIIFAALVRAEAESNEIQSRITAISSFLFVSTLATGTLTVVSAG